jgi:hypothetical protein
MCPFGDGAALSDSRTTNRGDPLVRVTSTSARVNGNGSNDTRLLLGVSSLHPALAFTVRLPR